MFGNPNENLENEVNMVVGSESQCPHCGHNHSEMGGEMGEMGGEMGEMGEMGGEMGEMEPPGEHYEVTKSAMEKLLGDQYETFMACCAGKIIDDEALELINAGMENDGIDMGGMNMVDGDLGDEDVVHGL